jgi:hypothetical protein
LKVAATPDRWASFSPFPIGNKILGYIKIARENWLRDVLRFTDRFDFLSGERHRRSKASLVEFPQGLLVDGASPMEAFHHLMDGC